MIKKILVSVGIGALLVGCNSNEEKIEEKERTIQEQEMIEMTEEDEQSLKQLVNQYVQTINENLFEEHMSLYSSSAMNFDDTKAQKEADFKRGNVQVELLTTDVKKFEGDYAVIETTEKENKNSKVVEKKVQYGIGKESGGWKIEDVRIIEKKESEAL
ncbi:hypothetical protein BAMA_21915 [Bacillus manliponensis]|uniref:Lipoprotein n=1 Tax=Bacillus manliponensis TaxID=574376 RepID=A0A073KB02_9BACI|nr:hypothetical protein [Bacillus manliponensis]KEK19453.1 hypothetical protein BAMA_21915 [Bacillus manliponensis]